MCRNIIYSSVAAFVVRSEFNRFITIHWQKGGLTDREAAWATGRFIKYCSDWMRHHRSPCVWLWVRENDGDQGRIGTHVHILFHVPPDLAPLFRKFPYRWIKLISTCKPMKGMLKSKTIRGYSSLVSSPELYLANLDYYVHYILKAAPADVADRLCLRFSEKRGRVIGKRAAVCQLLLERIKSARRPLMLGDLSE
ncbi:MAG: hypothetical protein ABJN65_07055 [Parasphingorhabdus sp.]